MSAPCEGYACPPSHSVPVSEVIVHRFAPDLAATGVDLSTAFAWAAVGLALIAVGLALVSLHYSAKARAIRRNAQRQEDAP